MADRQQAQPGWQEPRTWFFGTPMKTEVIGLTIAMLVVWVLSPANTSPVFWLWFPVGWLILTRPWRLMPYLHHHRAVQAAQQEAAQAEERAKHEAARVEEQARRGYL